MNENFFSKISGVSRAITIRLELLESGFRMSMGVGKWKNFVVPTTIILLSPHMWFVTGGMRVAATWTEKVLMDELWKFIQNYVEINGGRRTG